MNFFFIGILYNPNVSGRCPKIGNEIKQSVKELAESEK
jgi:hypothetical protein